MFEDLRSLLKDADLPDAVKVPVTILVKTTSWLVWLFVGIGLILDKQYFFYWLAFFLFTLGVVVATLIYALVAVIRSALPAKWERREGCRLVDRQSLVTPP